MPVALKRLLAPLRMAALLGLVVLAACDSAEDRLANHLEQGDTLLESGDVERALLEYRNALQIDDQSIAAHKGMADVYEAQANLRGMFSHLNRIIELDPANTDALVRSGRVLMVGNDLDRALENADLALQTSPEDPDAIALKAAVSLRLGNSELALELARRALVMVPGDPVAGSVLIGERLQVRDLEGALALADEIIAQTPDVLSLYVIRLQILEQLGRDAAVVTQLREMIERFPDNHGLRQTLAQWHLRHEEFDAAEEQLRALAELVPEDAQASLAVVRFLIATQGTEAGRAELDRLITAGEGPVVQYRLAVTMLDAREGRTAEAETALREMVADLAGEDETNANRARLQLARLRLAAEDRETARTLVQDVLANDARNVDALSLRAGLAFQDGDYDTSLLDLRAALAEAPQNAGLLRLSAQANLRLGNADLARERYGAAVRASDYEATVTMEYARLLAASGNYEAVAQVMGEAVQRAPGNRDLLTALASAQLRTQDWIGADRTAQRLAEIDRGAADRIRAASLTGQNRVDESIEILSGLAEDPEDGAGALGALIQVYIRSGQVDRARAFLTSVLDDNPENPEALVLMAALDVNAGDMEAAEERYRTAVAAAPDRPGVHLAYARFLNGRPDRTGDAIAVLRTGIDATGENGGLRLFLAALLELQGEFEAAIAEYETLYAAQPGSVLAANNLASLLAEHRLDDPESIRRAYEIAYPLRGIDMPALQDTYGWITYLQGQPEDSLRWLVPAVEGLPDNPLIHYHIARAYSDIGRTEDARRHFETAQSGALPDAIRAEVEQRLESLPAPETPEGAAGEPATPPAE